MQHTALELVQRLLAEGRTTDEIRAALSGEAPALIAPAAAPYGNAPAAVRNEAAARALSAQTIVSNSLAPAMPATQRNNMPPAYILPSGDSAAKAGVPAPSPVAALPSARIRTSRNPLWLSDRLHAGWIAVLLACLFPIVVMVLDAPLASRFGTLSASMLTLGDITGVVGLVMYVCSLVLSARFKLVEQAFGGLNRVLTAHQLLGSLSLVLILMHPVCTAASYYQYGISTVAHFFVPQIAYIGSAFGIFALIIMVFLLMLTLFFKLAYRTWLATHKYLGLAYALIALHVIYTPNHITSDHAMLAYLYALLVIGAAAYIYRTLLPNIFIRRYLYTISRAEPKGVGVVEVTLKPVDRGIRFTAGQFIFISINSDAISPEWHPFSIASADTASDLRIDVRSLGAYTQSLTQLLPYMTGLTVRVEGAYGRFSFRNFGNPNQVWVAGGIGITPFLSMAQALGTGAYNIDLYYAVKMESELIDLSVLAHSESAKPGQVFRVFPFITQKYNSHLNASIIAKNTGDLAARDFLLCGPSGMMEGLTHQLIEMGVKPRQIHSEDFTF